jgi:zinc protease
MQDIPMFHQTFPRLLLVGIGLLLSLGAQANPFETTLANGMKVIVKEDHRAPSVVHMVWYRTGSMDEPEGVSGVAHMLEHLMFKGTKTLKAGEFNKRVAAVGGRDNAFTSKDYTAYFQQVPPSQLGQMMTLEADRMRNLVITDDEFARELAVVQEERRLRTDDQPRALVYEQLMSTAFQAHPYRRPVIGWMSDLDAMKPADARSWYRRWYTPNNAYLVVVGDVDHKSVFEMARERYGKLKTNPLPERRISTEPEQHGPRTAVVRAPAELPYLSMAWKVPALRNPDADRDAYALQVLAAILDGYDGARLNSHLVRDTRVAMAAGAGYDGTGRGPSLFYLDGVPGAGQSMDTLETALRAELQRIRDEGVSEAELNRVKTQALASKVYKRDSLMGQAMEIGYIEAAGLSWRDDERLLEGLREVTADEVRAVAQRYFSDDTLSIARLDPLPVSEKTPRAPVSATRH